MLSAAAFGLYARCTQPWTALGWVMLVPWLAALDRARSLRATLAVALLMTVAFEVAGFGWFAEAVERYTATPAPVALVLLALFAPLLQPQLITCALARWATLRRGSGALRVALAGACAWVGTEWAVPKLFGDTIGYGLWPSAWMRQGADVAGLPGLTLVLLLGNDCALVTARALAGGVHRRAATAAAMLAALAAALMGYGVVRERALAPLADRVAPVEVGIVQADIGRYDRLAAARGTFGAVEAILGVHVLLSQKLLRHETLDLLVWPETVYPTTFGTPKSPEGAAFDGAIASFVSRTGIPLVFGAYDSEDGHEFNAAVLLEPARTGPLAFETYRKATLFPLTERVPALLDGTRVRRWLPWLGSWTPGAGGDVLTVTLRGGRRLRVAPLICYDALAPALARNAVRSGAELIVTLSNDGWFGSGPAPWLHLVGAAFRSVETRRPQVRATNTGISAVIDAQGGILTRTDTDERAVLAATVMPVAYRSTLVLRWGDWLGPLALGALIALLVAPAWRPDAPVRRR
ncbi:MAG TPA: apolipoprotein N-acyltransferase [Candidatus Binatia bacterium]|nr:apolipoprotein N-acyltransferase [Candidatus Binatia bacterium]